MGCLLEVLLYARLCLELPLAIFNVAAPLALLQLLVMKLFGTEL